MAEYEVIREIPNLCRNNQMRDVFVSEVETDDPVAWVRSMIAGRIDSITTDTREDGSLTVFVESAGLFQKFSFTRFD